jgi:hypothetical protein
MWQDGVRERSEEMKSTTLLRNCTLVGACLAFTISTAAISEAGPRNRRTERPAVKELHRSKHACSKKCRSKNHGNRGGYVNACNVWYANAERAWYSGSPFFLHARTGFYLGGLALEFEINRALPKGYVYVHAGTGRTFKSFRAARRWCRQRPNRRPFFTVVDTRQRGCYR